MVDSRFFTRKNCITIQDVCRLIGIQLPADCTSDTLIFNISRAGEAFPSDVTFLHNRKYAHLLARTRAYACIIPHESVGLVPDGCIPLAVSSTHLALALILRDLYSIRTDGIDKTLIEDGCNISSSANIGEGCVIKKGTFIGHNTTILHCVEIGENSHIESNVTIGFSIIGNEAYIKAGARIGQQGFGFHIDGSKITDIPQVGRTLIGNNVQIGANCTIDRGSLSDTIIGDNVRIDDMVHIAHNVEIGDGCAIAAQTGIAGSTKVGRECVFGGQVGIAGHLAIGDNVVIAAQSGIIRDVKSGARVAGYPGVNIVNWHRQNVILRRLVERRRDVD